MTQADLVYVDARTASSRAVVSGDQRKEKGMQLALEAEKQEWVKRFTFLAKTYLTSLEVGARFALEDLRANAAACELAAPHSSNVWGSMPRVLINAGLPIEPTGEYRKARSPETHAHPVALYRKTGGTQ